MKKVTSIPTLSASPAEVRAAARPGSGWLWKPVWGALLGLLLATAQAQTNYQTILSFGPLPSGGSSPRGELVEGSDGWLYGTTYAGGSKGCGTVFKVDKTGAGFTVLHCFTNGYFPYGGVVEANDGTLCGTTSSGLDNAGSVFKLNRDGSGYAVLHLFVVGSGDGAQPAANLAVGQGGVLLGTTSGGGTAGNGTVFSLNADGTGYQVLHHFGATDPTDGSTPQSGLCVGRDGALYGTTQGGGSNNLGTVFKLNPDGTSYTVLHHFSGAPLDGSVAYGQIVQGGDGLLYGTTYEGGTNDSGTVFRLGTDGAGYAVLMSFAGGSQGAQPFAGLVQARDGCLYGTTFAGGENGIGTVFTVCTNGTGFAVLHCFAGIGGEGSQPLAPLLQGSDGALYGSTYWGGVFATNGASGTLFRLTFGLTPPTILGQGMVEGNFQLSFSGPTNQSYTVLATTNMALRLDSWTVVTNGTFSGTATFVDPETSAHPARFYTVRSP